MNLSSDEPSLGNRGEPNSNDSGVPNLGKSDDSLKDARNETPVLKRSPPGSSRTLRKYSSMKVVSPSL